MYVLLKESKYGVTYFSVFLFPHFDSDVGVAKKFNSRKEAQTYKNNAGIRARIKPLTNQEE